MSNHDNSAEQPIIVSVNAALDAGPPEILGALVHAIMAYCEHAGIDPIEVLQTAAQSIADVKAGNEPASRVVDQVTFPSLGGVS